MTYRLDEKQNLEIGMDQRQRPSAGSKVLFRIIGGLGALLFLLFVVAVIASQHSRTQREKAASPAAVCRAAIGAMMGRDPAIISAEPRDGHLALAYTRQDDGTVWRLRCRLEGARVMWATETGRWRDHPDDPKVYFHILGSRGDFKVEIQQRYTDGSTMTKVFPVKELEAGGGDGP